jgi:hypothetical protein
MSVPVKVLEEFSDPEAGLYKKLKAREDMNTDFEKVETFASTKWACVGAMALAVILSVLSQFSVFYPELLDFAWIISAPAVSMLISLIVYAVQEESFARIKKGVKKKDN